MPVRVIPCLDVRGGRVVKGVNFAAIRDAGDPEECAARYEADGADELVVLDISATGQRRATALETVERVAGALFIPLTAGGGVRTIEDFRALLRAGADRVAINTAAVQKPDLIREARAEFGAQAVVLSCDAKKSGQGYEVMVRGGKEPAGIDAVQWCAAAAEMGCGEILLTSVDRDGTHGGFDLGLLRAVSAAVRVSIIASGGAGSCEHFREAVEHGAQAVLAASQFHDGHMRISDVKRYLDAEGIPVR
ncbi:MAG TPA: imidazole glycerol phosphate synthase subunit HisF [Thermoanaerobaculia bacterium]|nr:imidazole glycerol phosphate synthase subunit HisF [Thermoanaerobaculia bacterium]